MEKFLFIVCKSPDQTISSCNNALLAEICKQVKQEAQPIKSKKLSSILSAIILYFRVFIEGTDACTKLYRRIVIIKAIAPTIHQPRQQY